MKNYSLDTIAANSTKVIIDTSILEASKAPPYVQVNYERDLRKTFIRRDNIFTIDEVFIEANKLSSDLGKRLNLRKFKTQNLPFYLEFLQYLIPIGEREGLIGTENSLKTDMKLAALVFALSANSKLDNQTSVSFASSDRRLTDFIYTTYGEVRNFGAQRGFPAQINARIRVYNFVQKIAKFEKYG